MKKAMQVVMVLAFIAVVVLTAARFGSADDTAAPAGTQGMTMSNVSSVAPAPLEGHSM